MNIIVAVDKNWGIGYKGDLLTKIPEDLRRFKELTYRKIVVMGRKTYESLPKHLDGRHNIVLTSNLNYRSEKGRIQICTSLSNTLLYLDYLLDIGNYSTNDIFIIGGGKVYETFLPFCDKVYLTKIYKEYEADTFFPNLDKATGWEVEYMEASKQSVTGDIYQYIEYRNRDDRNFIVI